MDRLPEHLPTAGDCSTLAEYREWCLDGITQAALARSAGTAQARISAIETGRTLPRRASWPALMRAYQIADVAQFYRLLRNSVKARALQADYASMYPLFTQAAVEPALVTELHAKGQGRATA